MIPKRDVCNVCNKRLKTQPFLVTRTPNGIHLECRDWSRVPFPEHFDEMLGRLRRVQQQLTITLALVDATRKWLAKTKRRWPNNAAETVSGVTQRQAQVRAALSKLRWPSGR